MLEANRGRKMATKAEVLSWIYNRMVAGEAFVTAREEASGMFEISDNETLARRRERYASGLQEEAALARAHTIEAELRKTITDTPARELVDDATNDKIVSCAASRFEVIEIDGIEPRSEKRKGNN